MKTKIIPFDLELAKKIQAGEVAGTIKTKNGLYCKIVSYCNGTDFFVEITTETRHLCWCYPYTKDGRYIDGKNNGGTDYDLILELPEETPKTQADLCEEAWLEEQKHKPYIKQLLKLKDYTEQLMEVNQGVIDNLDNLVQDLKRICEPPEQKHGFKVGDKVSYAGIMGYITNINKNLVDIDPIICGIFHNVSISEIELVEEATKHEFEPFDKVLVRNEDHEAWNARLYDVWFAELGLHGTQDNKEWKQCIPYDGNETLAGTTNNPNKR